MICYKIRQQTRNKGQSKRNVQELCVIITID